MPSEKVTQHSVPQKKLLWLLTGPIAAIVILAGLLSWLFNQDSTFAKIVSAENAGWESSLATTVGSRLAAGELYLKSGLASLNLDSGVSITLEGPAHFELIDSMSCRLFSGAAVLTVSGQGKGFQLLTPKGYAIDHGTSFSVTVDEQSAAFEVLEGEISVHSGDGGESHQLLANDSARLIKDQIIKSNHLVGEESLSNDSIIRIGTNGREASIIENDKYEYLHSDMLMVKAENNNAGYDRRSLIGFDLSKVDIEQIRTAKLRLNLVPSGMGFAASLPEINTFAVYGLSEAEEDKWAPGCSWQDGPSLGEIQLLGRFELARSVNQGSCFLGNQQLVDFLHSDTDSKVSFLIIRETKEINISGLVHAFASSSHPEVAGPAIELKY